MSRFLFSSSCSIYGAAGEDSLNEEAKFNPVTPYGFSKVIVERDVAALADSNFSPTFLRNATVYGVSPRLRFDLVLNNLVAWALPQERLYQERWNPVASDHSCRRRISRFCVMSEIRAELDS